MLPHLPKGTLGLGASCRLPWDSVEHPRLNHLGSFKNSYFWVMGDQPSQFAQNYPGFRIRGLHPGEPLRSGQMGQLLILLGPYSGPAEGKALRVQA